MAGQAVEVLEQLASDSDEVRAREEQRGRHRLIVGLRTVEQLHDGAVTFESQAGVDVRRERGRLALDPVELERRARRVDGSLE